MNFFFHVLIRHISAHKQLYPHDTDTTTTEELVCPRVLKNQKEVQNRGFYRSQLNGLQSSLFLLHILVRNKNLSNGVAMYTRIAPPYLARSKSSTNPATTCEYTCYQIILKRRVPTRASSRSTVVVEEVVEDIIEKHKTGSFKIGLRFLEHEKLITYSNARPKGHNATAIGLQKMKKLKSSGNKQKKLLPFILIYGKVP